MLTVSASTESLTTNRALNSKPDSETSLQKETSRQALDKMSRESLENLHGKDSEKPNLIHNFLNNPVLYLQDYQSCFFTAPSLYIVSNIK